MKSVLCETGIPPCLFPAYNSKANAQYATLSALKYLPAAQKKCYMYKYTVPVEDRLWLFMRPR